MQGVTTWSFHPYKPLLFDTGDIYICRVYPGRAKIAFDWLPIDGVTEYTVFWQIRDSGDNWESETVSGTSFVREGLADETDYAFYVTAGAKKSRVRLARTGDVPGDVVVNYLHPDDPAYSFSGQYLCSPSMVRHPDGYLLASMDVFKSGAPQDLTLIFRSDDNGATWQYVSELFPCFWGRMFIHKGDLYMIANSTECGDMLIGRSPDGCGTRLNGAAGRPVHTQQWWRPLTKTLTCWTPRTGALRRRYHTIHSGRARQRGIPPAISRVRSSSRRRERFGTFSVTRLAAAIRPTVWHW